MRFAEHGPAIPDTLLAAQERGEVIFLCGAGVSMPAGLPSFLRLAKLTADALSVPQHDPMRAVVERALAGEALTQPLDTVFERFKEVYGERQVEARVARLIRTAPDADISRHQTILKLSRDAGGRSRVLTTNFDTLFERAEKKLKAHVAPHLPRLDCHDLEGAIYLHGRASASSDRPLNLVLSSSDFGRAYMAQGWATEFMREALQRFVVVLVGYSADDPPVNYLLRGMRALNMAHPIYAFAEVTGPEVRSRWRERNVEALLYAPHDAGHNGLWDTLHGWANRAVDPEAWRSRVIEMAKAGPRSLKPYERGQVVSLIKTEPGTRALVGAGKAVPAEWLCVFDHAIRRAAAGALGHEGDAPFDPRPYYGLDDDPEDRLKRDARLVIAHDLMSAQSSDGEGLRPARLSGAWSDHAAALPMRLHHLSGWIAAHWASPLTIWWAAGRGALHPDLIERVEHARRTEKVEAKLERQAWSLIEEACAFPDDDLTRDWWKVEATVQREGWTSSTLRAFARVVRPKLSMSRPHWSGFTEPVVRLNDLVMFDIAWFKRAERLPRLEGGALPRVIVELREALRIGASLASDVEPGARTSSLHPHKGPGEPLVGRSGQFYLYFAKQFEVLAKNDPAAARREWLAWPQDEPIFFDKLRLWVWSNPAIATPDDVSSGFGGLSDRSFWSHSAQRELLWALKARWAELTASDRESIEARMFAGRDKLAREDEVAHKLAIAKNAVERLRWLEQNGCELSATAQEKLAAIIAELGEEATDLSAGADYVSLSYSGFVATIEDTSEIIDLPIREIIPRCRAVEGERDYRKLESHDPFQGLAKQRPLLALKVLSVAAKAGQYPKDYWDDLLRNWPEAASSRASWLLAQRIAKLPVATIVSLHSTTAEWLRACHERIDAYRVGAALSLWDKLFDAFAGGGIKADSSLLSGADDTFDKAFNAPVGRLTSTLLHLLNALKLKPGSVMPSPFASRLEGALAVPPPGGAHAASFCGADFHWLGTVTPTWVETELLPRFDLHHPQAVAIWDGLFNTGRPLQAAWFGKLKPSFLAALRDAGLWGDGEGARRLGQLLCHAVMVSTPKRTLMTQQEARLALQTTTETVREAALDLLQEFVAKPNGWRRYGARFLSDVWPLELALQTERTARAWLDIALSARGSFADIARALTASSALIIVEDVDMFAWSMRGENETEPLAKLHPEAALSLLDAVVGERRPYEMDQVLDMIAEAEPGLRQDRRWLRLRLGRAA